MLITSDDVVDRLLQASTREKLKQDHFKMTPPEYNANRTIVLRNIDSLITTVDTDDLRK